MNIYLILGIILLVMNARTIYENEKLNGEMNWFAVVGGCCAIFVIVTNL